MSLPVIGVALVANSKFGSMKRLVILPIRSRMILSTGMYIPRMRGALWFPQEHNTITPVMACKIKKPRAIAPRSEVQPNFVTSSDTAKNNYKQTNKYLKAM